MRPIGKIIGYPLWIGAGILMFIFWLMAMSSWLGFFGTFLAFVLAPGFFLLPIVFWIVEGVFPIFYFILWGIGMVGMIIVNVSSNDD
jgi:hypothetical protein